MTDHRCSVDYQSEPDADGMVAVMLRKLEDADVTPDAMIGRFELLASALRGMSEVATRKGWSERARWQIVEAVLYAAKLTIGGTREC